MINRITELGNERWYLALALAGEAGELANASKKEWRDGGTRDEEIRLEAADILIYLRRLASVRGFDLEQAVADKTVINQQRWGKDAY